MSKLSVTAWRDKEPRRVGHGLLTILLEHEFADIDAQPILSDVLGGWKEALAVTEDVLEALAGPVVSRTGVISVGVVVRRAVRRQRVRERLVLHQLHLKSPNRAYNRIASTKSASGHAQFVCLF